MVLAVVGLLLLAWVVAVAVSGVQAGRALQRVAASSDVLAQDLRAERFGEAVPLARQVSEDSVTAARATNQWPYRAAEHVPWVGTQLRAVGGVSEAAALLAEPLPGALGVAESVLGRGLVSADRTVDLAGVQALEPVVADYARRLPQAQRALDSAEAPGVLAPIAERVAPVAATLDTAAPPLATAAQVAPRLPAMLGAGGARTYLVAFTNPAEIRPVQGMFGAYAYLTVTDGHIELTRTGSDEDLYDARADPGVLGDEFVGTYGAAQADLVQNVTVSGNADDAGRLAADLMVDAGLPRPDAVVLVDPVGLADMLGPDHPPLDLGPFGQVPTADLATTLLYEAYVRFEGDQPARKAFLTATSAAAFEAILSDGLSSTVLRGMGEAVRSGHLAVWSAVPGEQSALVAAGVGGLLGDPAAQPGVVKVGLTNAVPSKLDYWMQPAFVVEPSCSTAAAAEATSILQLTLTNPVPEEIPQYMRNQRESSALGSRTGQDIVSLWVPPWVGLQQAVVDGSPVATAVDDERGWRLIRLTVQVPPDRPVVVRWTLTGRADALPRTVEGPSTVTPPTVTTVGCP